MMRCRLAAVIGFVALTAGHVRASAQTFPERPVRIIVPSDPGGGYDQVGRLISEQLTQKLPGSYVVENVSGAGTLVGTRQAARATPDGYTLLTAGLSNIVLNLGLYGSPGYTGKDFVAVGVIYTAPYAMIARNDLPQNSLQDILAAGREKPGSLNVATAGPGTGQDVIATLFASLGGLKITKVPYKGAAPVYPELMAGRVDLFFDTLSTGLALARAGSVRVVGIIGNHRAKVLPNVPTLSESGLANPFAEVGSWIGLFAPAKTPAPVLATLRGALARAVADPNFQKKIETAGGEMLTLIGDDAQKLVESETAKWLPQMKAAGIQPQ